MKKQILDALKAKFEGVSEAILNRIADKIVKTVTSTEQIEPTVEKVSFQQVLESYGDSRATEAQQTAVSNYEKKHNLKDGQKIETGGGNSKPTEETQPTGSDIAAQIAAAVKAAVQPLTEEIATLKQGRVTENRRQRLNLAIEKLPVSFQKAYGRTPVENLSDEEFDNLISEIGTEVKDIVSETNAKGAVFGRPVVNGGNQQSGGVKEATKEEAEAVVNKLNI